MLGFSFGLFFREGSDTSATTGCTDGKTWERAWGELRGGSDTEATTGWTDGKPWEIAWGELR